jgi:hypothetical protein
MCIWPESAHAAPGARKRSEWAVLASLAFAETELEPDGNPRWTYKIPDLW